MFFLVSLRTNIATLLTLRTLVVTLPVLAVRSDSSDSVLEHIGGGIGIIVAVEALLLAAAGFCKKAYGRPVFPLGQLGPEMIPCHRFVACGQADKGLLARQQSAG